ncbi:vacuolar protein sorting-associated protein 74 [Lichtheimia corymbifera JMRC:FSU:9682]|uniref:Vacuolar protein sorting-associated protein 74 n=1 Tax=Lichtheimia corymbifera JMRC:FSU:9682 TaxID=1263082 RepID=A0A068RXA3_9FUNG|nr:vacuolar protein sorting-associated protein 74 [Lichtheimia corymbifera JMRC:FSU:9682]
MSTITRRRVAGASSSTDDNNAVDGSHSPHHNATSPSSEKKIAYDPDDIDDSKSTPRLTLMEEVLLLGLKDRQGYLSFWNDSISYALRGCIVMELALRGRIAMVKDSNRRKYPLTDRYIEVINDKLTGEVLLDEALKMMKISEKMSVASWVDLMSDDSRRDMECHEDRIPAQASEGTFGKRIGGQGHLANRETQLFIIRHGNAPYRRHSLQRGDYQTYVPHAYLRTVCMICAAYAANVLENALLYMQPDLREQAFNKVDELMNDFSTWPFAGSGAKNDIRPGSELSLEVVAATLNVLTKMDAIL